MSEIARLRMNMLDGVLRLDSFKKRKMINPFADILQKERMAKKIAMKSAMKGWLGGKLSQCGEANCLTSSEIYLSTVTPSLTWKL